MLEVSDEQFHALIGKAIDSLPEGHMQAVRNVAITYADDPTPYQSEVSRLRGDQLLLGLYEGVPLTRRQGVTSYGPDKITLFKRALCAVSHDLPELQEQIRHTLWHEIAHYFGLNHEDIHNRE